MCIYIGICAYVHIYIYIYIYCIAHLCTYPFTRFNNVFATYMKADSHHVKLHDQHKAQEIETRLTPAA